MTKSNSSSPSDAGRCERGHEFELVGRDELTGLCNACAAMLRRLRSKHDRGPKPRTVDDQIVEAIRTNHLLELYDRKDRAVTSWERDQIQQEINRIR